MSTESRSLELDCGGRVLLEVDADWLHMSDTDLMFVRGLASAMDDHRAGAAEALCTPAEPPPAPAPSPDESATCEDCGQVCSTVGGLGVHRARSHGAKNENPLDRYYVGTSTDGRQRLWRCHCGYEGRGGAGLRAHLQSHERADRTPPAVSDSRTVSDMLAVALVPAPAIPTFDAVHRIAREDNGTGAKRIYCSCGWVTPPHSDRVVARQDFADHLDGVACQSESA